MEAKLKQLIILLALFTLVSCNADKKDYPYIVHTRNGEKWDKTYTSIECDSLNFINDTIVDIYRDGTKVKIMADRINVNSNN